MPRDESQYPIKGMGEASYKLDHSYIYRVGEYIAGGPEWNLSATTAKISENIGKCRFALKNTKINIFFQFF